MKLSSVSFVAVWLIPALVQYNVMAEHVIAVHGDANLAGDKHLRGLTASDNKIDNAHNINDINSVNMVEEPDNADHRSVKMAAGTTTCMCIKAPCNCNVDGPPMLDESNLTKCPVISPAVTCPVEQKVHICGSLNCNYPNACSAQGAGWNAELQCRLEGEGLVFDDKGCPVTGPAITCMKEFEPHMCSKGKGSPQCEYSSACLAQGAGWNVSTQCEAAMIKPLSTCPKANKPCSKLYEPYVCSDDEHKGCKYQNKCLARSAGFRIRKHCKKVQKK
jgi:hypothetical protein